jgi:hypothetical protein
MLQNFKYEVPSVWVLILVGPYKSWGFILSFHEVDSLVDMFYMSKSIEFQVRILLKRMYTQVNR